LQICFTDEYPEIFFSTVVELECEELEKKIKMKKLKNFWRKRIAKHRKGEKPEDIISVLQNAGLPNLRILNAFLHFRGFNRRCQWSAFVR